MLLLALLLASGFRSPINNFDTEKAADGIYAFVATEGRNGLVSGNSVAIVGDDGVVVVDSGHFPSLTRRMVAELRKVTPKPVRFLVNTHWHPDHHAGNFVWREAFPGVSVISTEYTREQMEKQAGRFDRPESIRDILPVVEQRLASGKNKDGTPLTANDRAYLQGVLEDGRAVIPELEAYKPSRPDAGFERKLTLHLGKRIVEVMFLGRGNTGGDAVVYVPDAKLLATGDLVVAPTPYGIGSFFGEWIETLGKLSALEAGTIVPGHGPVQHDKRYIDQLVALFSSVRDQAKAAVAQGLTLEQFRTKADVAKFRKQFAGDDPARIRAFDDAFVTPGLARAYREAKEGPLKDED